MPAVRKQLLLGELRGEGFWERDDRFAVMAEVEYLDRLEEATRTAGHLADRLLRARDPAVAEEVAGLLANRLLVLEAALGGLEDEEAPFEVALRLSPAARAPGEGDLEADAFLEQLVAMYRGWAGRCGMTIVPLPAEESSSLMLVSGLGAGAILGGEAGLHVAEHVEPGDDGATTDRVGVAVEVAGVPPGEPVDRATFLVRVLQALDAAPAAQRVTRRYRFEPDTLVRDAVRNYRTGRLDRVLAGEFDLY
jgi:ATP-dependent Clp protease ATP-binding subunit ClpC